MEMHEELKKRTGEVETVVERYLPKEDTRKPFLRP